MFNIYSDQQCRIDYPNFSPTFPPPYIKWAYFVHFKLEASKICYNFMCTLHEWKLTCLQSFLAFKFSDIPHPKRLLQKFSPYLSILTPVKYVSHSQQRRDWPRPDRVWWVAASFDIIVVWPIGFTFFLFQNGNACVCFLIIPHKERRGHKAQ
jgi:hypothetical protein